MRAIFYSLSVFALFFQSFTSYGVDGVYLSGPYVNYITAVSEHNLGRVNAVVQDEKGFIWLATQNGLFRYDGFSARRFDKSGSGLPHNHVKDIVIDGDFLWLATLGGLSKMDMRTEQFANYLSHAGDAKTLDSNHINTLVKTPDAQLWIGTDSGLNRFDINTAVNRRLTLNQRTRKENPDDSSEIYELLYDAQGYLWYSTNGKGLYQYHLLDAKLQNFRADESISDSINSNMPDALMQSKDGTIWVGSDVGLNRYLPDKKAFKHYSVPIGFFNKNDHVDITSLMEDKDGHIWVGSSYNGVSILPLGSEHLVNVNHGGDGNHDLTVRFVNDIFEDTDGGIWIASSWKGLVRINGFAGMFDNYRLSNAPSRNIQALYADSSGELWSAVNADLFKFDGGNWQFQKRLTDAGIVTFMDEDVDGNLLLAIGGQGVIKYHKDSGRINHYAATAENVPMLPSYYLHSLAVSEQGEVWAGLFRTQNTRAGLFKFDTEAQQYQLMLPDITVESILPLENAVYAGTRREGLMVYDRRRQQWQRVDSDSQQVSTVWQVYQDSEQRIWLATDEAGLGLLDRQTMTVSLLGMKEGLPSNSVRSVVEGVGGELWLATAKGVVRYEPQSGQIASFDSDYGVKFDGSMVRSAAVRVGNQIIMADAKQLVHFDAEKLTKSMNAVVEPLPLMLSDFRLFNETVGVAADGVLQNPINFNEAITLTYRDYLFSLSFASAHFSHQQRIKYAYKVEGLTDRWVQTDKNNRMATVISAEPGNYTLKVKSTDPQGNWQNHHRSLKITVTPPWWLTWQAKLMYVLLSVLSIVGFYLYRTRALVRRAEQLEQEVTQRTETINRLMNKKEQMFANISHEFKTPLTLILTPLEALLAAKPAAAVSSKVSMALRNGQRLLRMVEQLLELSRLDTFEQKKEHHYSLKQILSVLLTSFKGLAEQKRLTLNCNTFDDAIVPSTLDALEMVLINLISNAIKYTPDGGIIDIVVVNEDNWVSISVKDNGIGISEENQQLIFNRFTRASESHGEAIPGAGIGLALVKELVENHQGSITLSSAQGRGSEFVVRLPTVSVDAQEIESVTTLSGVSLTEMEVLEQTGADESDAELSQPSVDIPEQNDKATLLLIDDNTDMLALLKDTLHTSYNILQASDGQSGLEMAAQTVPDLIISDVMMPGISGYEVASKLKAEQMTCHIPIVLLTAKGDLDSRMQGWQQDIDDYLAKPFHPQELLLRVQSLLSIRRILKRRYTVIHDGEVQEQQSSPVLSDKDQAFLTAFDKVLDENFIDPDFNREQAAELMLISDHQLYRKLTALLDDTFTDLLRERRLKASVEMLKTGLQISQISDKVGFSSVPYFSKCFKARFGKTPKQYQKTLVI